MGKKIKIPVYILILLLIYCCKGSTSTPKEYIYHRHVERTIYQKDSINLYPVVLGMLLNNIDPFGVKIYDENSRLYIDTLIYSPDCDRIVFWVAVRNSTIKLEKYNSNKAFFYDGFCMYARKNGNKYNVYEHAPYVLSTFDNRSEIHNALWDYSFKYISTFKNSDNEPVYNMNDKRFWTESLWSYILSCPSYYIKDGVLNKEGKWYSGMSDEV